MSYKVTIVNQADVIFPSFGPAFEHLSRRVRITVPRNYVEEQVDAGDVFRAVYMEDYGELEKVA